MGRVSYPSNVEQALARKGHPQLDADQACVEVIISIESAENAEHRAEQIQELLDEHIPELHAAIAVELPPS